MYLKRKLKFTRNQYHVKIGVFNSEKNDENQDFSIFDPRLGRLKNVC